MENAIKEGELKILAAETPCDVVLCCKNQKLTAHKLLLSIASPILQELLLQDSSETTTLIFPDIEGQTMSLVLDYIYRGNVSIPAYHFPSFVSLAKLLNIKLDFTDQVMDFILKKDDGNDCDGKVKKKINKKIPNLMPILSLNKNGNATKKGLYNRVFPSPWCPRVVPLLADPREDYASTNEQLISPHSTNGKYMDQNDTNNNFQIHLQPIFSEKLLLNQLPNFLQHKNQELTYCDSKKSTNTLPKEIEDKKFIFEHTTIEYKQEIEKQEIIETIVDIKIEEKESSFKDVASSRSSETDEEVLKNEQKLNKHKPFKCQDCGKSFSQLRNYKYHRSIHEGTKEFSADCPECGKVFNDKGYLSSHMKIHRDRKEYACPSCPKRFNQRVAYNMHLRIHTGIKPHECPTCGKTFSRKMLLKQHQRVHTGERPYSCPECGKSFADRSNMSLHARLHTGVKPYACNLCTKSFTKKHHLKTHMNFHTGLKPYSCQKCGLAFSQSSNMRTHYKKCILKTTTTTINLPSS